MAELTVDTQRVLWVMLEITSGWLNAPHAVSVTITSVNGDPDGFFDHGTTEALISDLEVFANLPGESAIVILPINDQKDREFHSVYTICSHIIFADRTHGSESCHTGELFP